MSCIKFPHSKDARQSLLIFKPVGVDAQNNTHQAIASLGIWKFEQEAIRKSLTEMVIIDELPFKIVDGGGFNKFMSAACPCFKIPSRWTISRDCHNIFVSERLNLKKFMKEHCQKNQYHY